MSTPTLDLNKLPPVLAGKLLNALFARFLASGALEYDEASSTIKCVNCQKFEEELTKYVMSKKFNDALHGFIPPIGININSIKSILIDTRVDDILHELGTTEFDQGILKWGSNLYGRRGWITVQGVRMSYLTYALVTLAHASSVIAKYHDFYLYLVPLSLNKDLIARFTKARGKLSKLLRGINIEAVPEHFYHLLVASAIRVWDGAVELVWASRDFTVARELVLILRGYEPLMKALVVNDEEGLFTDFVAQVIRDYTSNDKDRVNMVKPFANVLGSLLAMTLGAGNTEQRLYDMLFTVTKVSLFKAMPTQMMMTRQTGNVSMYRWALEKLGKIVQVTYEKARYAIA